MEKSALTALRLLRHHFMLILVFDLQAYLL